MASYAFQTLEKRKKLQELWERGGSVKDMAKAINMPLKTVYKELTRGRDGTRLPDMRLRYDAELAHLNMRREIEHRGRRPYKHLNKG